MSTVMSSYWQNIDRKCGVPMCSFSVFPEQICLWVSEDVEVLQNNPALKVHQTSRFTSNLWRFRRAPWFTFLQYRALCTFCLIPSKLNERLISNAWDLLQNGPAIVESADEAGSLAGWPANCRYGKRWKRRAMATMKRGGWELLGVDEWAVNEKWATVIKMKVEWQEGRRWNEKRVGEWQKVNIHIQIIWQARLCAFGMGVFNTWGSTGAFRGEEEPDLFHIAP